MAVGRLNNFFYMHSSSKEKRGKRRHQRATYFPGLQPHLQVRCASLKTKAEDQGVGSAGVPFEAIFRYTGSVNCQAAVGWGWGRSRQPACFAQKDFFSFAKGK